MTATQPSRTLMTLTGYKLVGQLIADRKKRMADAVKNAATTEPLIPDYRIVLALPKHQSIYEVRWTANGILIFKDGNWETAFHVPGNPEPSHTDPVLLEYPAPGNE
jgi:hypothetical protein